jgi:GH35 family endo-1,4-beta-xylanase
MMEDQDDDDNGGDQEDHGEQDDLQEDDGWDDVNEAISNSDAVYLKDNVLTPLDDYVCLAFTTARAVREANGWDTILFYDEYDFESDQGDFKVKSDKV